mmetsp:Transcript_44470/g.73607  ORF Transcript_44470/g.73607 Transcript_44470/m.73607 type:complete len:218 (+) Transcript_44470:914-1567(+)
MEMRTRVHRNMCRFLSAVCRTPFLHFMHNLLNKMLQPNPQQHFFAIQICRMRNLHLHIVLVSRLLVLHRMLHVMTQLKLSLLFMPNQPMRQRQRRCMHWWWWCVFGCGFDCMYRCNVSARNFNILLRRKHFCFLRVTQMISVQRVDKFQKLTNTECATKHLHTSSLYRATRITHNIAANRLPLNHLVAKRLQFLTKVIAEHDPIHACFLVKPLIGNV